MSFDPSRYFTSEQQKYLSQRQKEVGYERALQLLSEWESTKKQFQAALNQGTDPTAPKLMPLAKQLSTYLHELIGDDPALNETFEQSKGKVVRDLAAVDPKQSELMSYIITSLEAAEHLRE